MSERITITIDENTRARLNAHPEITPAGLFEKATIEMDVPNSPEQILAWKEIEIARIDLEKTKLTIQHESTLHQDQMQMDQVRSQQEMQKDTLALQQHMMTRQRELDIKQDALDGTTHSGKMDIVRAKFEVARAKGTIKILQDAALEDGNIYLETVDELLDILKRPDLMILDTRKVGDRGKEIFTTLRRILDLQLKPDRPFPDITNPSDLLKGFEEEDPDPLDRHGPFWDHVRRIQSMVEEGKTHDEIVQIYAEDHPALWSRSEKHATEFQIRYWYDHFTAKRSEEE